MGETNLMEQTVSSRISVSPTYEVEDQKKRLGQLTDKILFLWRTQISLAYPYPS
jgi:hypothetical protein